MRRVLVCVKKILISKEDKSNNQGQLRMKHRHSLKGQKSQGPYSRRTTRDRPTNPVNAVVRGPGKTQTLLRESQFQSKKRNTPTQSCVRNPAAAPSSPGPPQAREKGDKVPGGGGFPRPAAEGGESRIPTISPECAAGRKTASKDK